MLAGSTPLNPLAYPNNANRDHAAHRSLNMPKPASSPKPSHHICPDCGRAYKAAETLNRHRKNHSESTPYSCSICTASFKRKDLLDRHIQIHDIARQPISRNRSHRACDRCSKLKTRCDNGAPCARCERGSHECTYRQTRCRARTDRSSLSATSVSSSVQNSPHITLQDVDCVDDSALPNQDSGEPVDGLWLEEPAWQWSEPNLDPNLLHASPSPAQEEPHRTTPLELALDEPLPNTNLFDDPLEGMSWYHNQCPTTTRMEILSLDPVAAIDTASPSDFSSGEDESTHRDMRNSCHGTSRHCAARSAFSSPASSSGPDIEGDRKRFFSLMRAASRRTASTQAR